MIFEGSEYLGRLRRTRERMAERAIEVLLISDPANINYLSGYDGWSFYVHQALLVAGDEEQPVWIGRGQDANAARVTTFLEPANIVPYPDHFVQSEIRHPMDFVADQLKARGWDQRRLGVEMDSFYFTAAAFESLRRNLPEAALLDARSLVNWVRIVKSDAEIALMRQAARIAEQVMRVAVDAVAPGVRQCDAVARIYEAQTRGTAEFGGTYTAIAPLLPTGTGTSTPHLTWDDAPFQPDTPTILELAGCRSRYHCPIARTVHLGPPPAHLADTAEVVVEGLNAAIEAARPGALTEEVEAAWRRVIERHGIVKESRIGYSVGLGYPPDWGERTLSLRPGDRTELQPNMTIHVIPGIWQEDWGIEISECIRITATGAETFCDFPRELLVKI
jgi:ectoine utilization protein EutD